MASAAPLKDIDEQFLQCCICMEQLKHPKILPCLHRYCRDCLKATTNKDAKKIECPTCREKHTLPEGGIDGLKTDFNTNNIIEFIQLQDSVKHEPLRVCGGCSQTLKVSAYCFRCNEFLCHGCHKYHTTAKILKDHRDHLFSPSEAEARNLTIEKLSSLKEAPRCHSHPQKLSELCCTTCGNLPVCMPCTYGAHRGHDLQEVTTLANVERDKLNVKMADLLQYKERIYKMHDEIRGRKERLRHSVDEKKKKLQEHTDVKKEITKRKIQGIEEKLKKRQNELEEKVKRKRSARKLELEEKLKKARDEYEMVCEEDRREADDDYEKLLEENAQEKVTLQAELDTINKNFKELLASLMTQEEENTRKTKELADNFEDIVKRFETVTMTASTILAAKNDWTDVQCIPDICTAIGPLIEEVKTEMPRFEILPDVFIKDLCEGRVHTCEKAESVVDIKGINKGWQITGITGNKVGSIVITGKTKGKKSHITVIKRTGEQVRQDIFQSKHSSPHRYCATLTQSKIASVCQNNEIGIYDVRNGAYTKTQMNVFERNWWVTCVAVDPVNKNIIGCGYDNENHNSELHVYDDQLRYIHSVTLPDQIKYPCGITAHNGNLLICDNVNYKAYAVTIKESRSTVVYKFPTPDDFGNCWPCSVCTDKDGFIHMLWHRNVSGKDRSIVIKYSRDCGHILNARLLDESYSTECISTLETEEGQKLVMATIDKGKLITYALK